jgi:hypothetical protein
MTVLPALERTDVSRHVGGGSLGATSEIGAVRAFFSGEESPGCFVDEKKR